MHSKLKTWNVGKIVSLRVRVSHDGAGGGRDRLHRVRPREEAAELEPGVGGRVVVGSALKRFNTSWLRAASHPLKTNPLTGLASLGPFKSIQITQKTLYNKD